MPVIGLDLGGTKLAAAIFSDRGKILHKNIAVLDGRKGSHVGKLITKELENLFAAARGKKIEIAGIGVSVPGIVHSREGTVWAPNIRGWTKFPLRRRISAVLPDQRIKVAIDSDRACSILGESWRGAARGCQNAIFLAVGTGIGAGILADGHILRGTNDIAGAIGWLALDRPYQAPYQSCGCFEYHASGTGLVKSASAGRFRSAQELFHAGHTGDAAAQQVLGEAVQFWGMAAANLVSLFNPQKIIFGGGVFGPAKTFLPQIVAEAKKWAQPVAIRQVKLEISKLGSDAALYGAACLALPNRKKTA